jgi:ABC-type multidrug transport system fused ATPase/permease subunit
VTTAFASAAEEERVGAGFVDVPPLDARSPARLLAGLVRDHRGPIALSVVYGIACMLALTFVPAVVGKAIDTGIIARDRQALLLWCGVVMGLGVVQAAAGILRDRCATIAMRRAAYQVMRALTWQASRLGATLGERMPVGEVINAGTADPVAIGYMTMIVGTTASGLTAIVVVAVLMLDASWQLGATVLVGVPLTVGGVALLLRPLHARQRRLRERQGELTGRAVDIAAGIRVVRGVGGEPQLARRYREESQQVRHAGVRVARVDGLLAAVNVLLPGLLVTFVVWLGGHAVADGSLSGGQLVAFYGYAAFMVIPLTRLTGSTSIAMQAYVAARHVAAVMSIEPRQVEEAQVDAVWRDGGLLADRASGLQATPGQLTAVACTAPADALALADRLGGYAPGDVTLDGIRLAALPSEELRRGVLVARNDARLLSGPLRVELDPGDGDDGLRLEAAIHAASARDVVEALEEGLDGVLARPEHELSGGERQRLRLARALMADHDVLVLVEPTSAMDAHTEARIAERLAAARAGRTTVVFATSPILLGRADRVAYVDDGRVVAAGTHATLLAHDGYRRLVAREDPR